MKDIDMRSIAEAVLLVALFEGKTTSQATKLHDEIISIFESRKEKNKMAKAKKSAKKKTAKKAAKK